MVRLYVLLTKEDHAALAAAERPSNCLLREFDTPQIEMSYRTGLSIAGGHHADVVRESHLEMDVVFEPENGSVREGTFKFATPAEKDAFRQGLEDSAGFPHLIVHTSQSPDFLTLEAMYAAVMQRIFIRCEEGSVALLKSFGARVSGFDAARHGVVADVTPQTLAQINQFPADFEVDATVAVETGPDEDDAESPTAEWTRAATLVFVRHEGAVLRGIGLLSLRTALATNSDVRGALIDAATEWVQKTETGRSLWVQSASVNIGALAGSGAFADPVFLAAMERRGITYADCTIVDGKHALNFDASLVDDTKLHEEQLAIPFTMEQPI